MPDERASALQSFSTEMATRRYIDNGVSARVEQARVHMLYGTPDGCTTSPADALKRPGCCREGRQQLQCDLQAQLSRVSRRRWAM